MAKWEHTVLWMDAEGEKGFSEFALALKSKLLDLDEWEIVAVVPADPEMKAYRIFAKRQVG